MSDSIKHECGISLIRLLKPLEYYLEKYGSAAYGLHKMYLMMEKQHNRGQDGAGLATIKLDMRPGQRYISRVRSVEKMPIQHVFAQVNERMEKVLAADPSLRTNVPGQKAAVPYVGELLLGHVRYGTFGKNGIESVHPFLRQSNWMQRNLIVAGNFNMTNVDRLFSDLVSYGLHPKELADTVTVMEMIGHRLDEQVGKLYKQFKKDGVSPDDAGSRVTEALDLAKILRKAAKNWDGGYAMAGLLGHGEAFVLRDPSGIRPAYHYADDEIVAVASERPAIQTVFNVPYEAVGELPPGQAIIVRKDGEVGFHQILEPREKKSCSFERIYFSRGSDQEIYRERKALGQRVFPKIMEAVDGNLTDTVFSYIPNTAETAFLGLVKEAQTFLNGKKQQAILEKGGALTPEALEIILAERPRIEKVAIKDAKLRTFITEDRSREDLVTHVYDISYGSVDSKDTLVIIDDSIVRGTTLKKSILKMLDRLGPKKIIVVSSAPQIRYPDCYGIDMAKIQDFIAFRAALSLHEERGSQACIKSIYDRCKASVENGGADSENHVKAFYEPFTPEEVSERISKLLSPPDIRAEVQVIYQSIEDLHKACPDNLGDWYFTGDYPTPGGNRVVNRAFVNFYEGNDQRAY